LIDLGAGLKEQEPRLRVLTCGSVDDGKSTLIGRLLYDCDQVAEDILDSAREHSPSDAIGPGGLDFSYLLDGLSAEREQGITIDVAYRACVVHGRTCQIADCPGHAQYTRNMATAASNCDVAIVLIDARAGLLEQTRRHVRICAMMGITHIVVAINKMDLVDWSEAKFDAIEAEFRDFAAEFLFDSLSLIPVSAPFGFNLINRAQELAWYHGPTLAEWLSAVEISHINQTQVRLAIQWVSRTPDGSRVYAGPLLSGSLSQGQEIVIGPEAHPARITSLYRAGEVVERAEASDAVAISLDRQVDLSRGDWIYTKDQTADFANQIAADIIWFHDQALTAGRNFWLKGQGAWVQGSVTRIRHKICLDTGQKVAADDLAINEIGLCNLITTQPILCDPYHQGRACGSFLIVDTISHATVGVGLIRHALRRAANITPVSAAIDAATRSLRYGQQARVIWLTGLSGAGKSTIAKLAEQILWAQGRATALLDGDNLRSGLCQDLGFTEADRVENVRRTAEAAKLLADAGLIVICALISPFARDRAMAQTIIGADRFIEVFIDAPVELCADRDPKGLYAKAKQGLIPNFTGVSAPYEAPISPDVRVQTQATSAEAGASAICDFVMARG
jgi:bifunctional enzyme CysN/CysC